MSIHNRGGHRVVTEGGTPKRPQGASPSSCLPGPSLHSRADTPFSVPGSCPPLPTPSPQTLCLWMDQPYEPWRVWPDPDRLFLFPPGKAESRRRGQATQEQGLTVAVVVMGEAKAKPNARGRGIRRGTVRGGRGSLPPGGAGRRRSGRRGRRRSQAEGCPLSTQEWGGLGQPCRELP